MSEVGLAIEFKRTEKDNILLRVVSVVSFELFDKQVKNKRKILPKIL